MIAILRLLLAGLGCCLALPAQAAFTDNGDGTITDTVTGLMWDKCSWGQSNTTDCSGGTASDIGWSAALSAAVTASNTSHRGYSDWRLPNRNELLSLVKIDAANPAIDTTAFPNTQSSYYFSSSTYLSNPANAWGTTFSIGVTSIPDKGQSYYVRLVRSGHSYGGFDSMAVPAAFSFTAQTNVATSTVVQSNPITLAGLTMVVGVSISGGEYKINSGAYTSAPGAANNGDQITVRLTSSASASTLSTATLAVGGASEAFNVTTAAPAVNGVCASIAATSFKPATGLCTSGTLNAAGVVKGATAWTWACDGSGSGTSTAANACSAPFAPTATSSGGAASEVSGGTWSFAPSGTGVNQTSGFIPTSGHLKSPPGLPPGYTFPHGLYDFVLTGGGAGSTATITLTYPSALPAGTVYWKYGPTAGNPANHWYQFPATIVGNTITLTLTDNADGDDAYTTNSLIVDAGGPGAPGAGVADIPTLSEWGLMLLSLLLGALARGSRGRFRH